MVAETESLLLGTSSKITAVKPVASNQARSYLVAYPAQLFNKMSDSFLKANGYETDI